MNARHYDWISAHAAFGPEREVLVDVTTGRRLTYAQLDRRVDQLAAVLQDHGVGRGDRVALLAYNGTEYFELQFACGRLGAIAVLLNWRLTVPELSFMIGHAQPRVLIHDVEFAPVAEELLERHPDVVTHTMCIDASADLSDYEEQLANAAGAPVRAELTLDDPAVMLYTSGTSGLPKGAIQTHGNLVWNAINVSPMGRVTAGSTQLVSMPLFHTGGLNAFGNPILHAGGRLLIQRTFDAEQALAILADVEQGCTHFMAVPAMYQTMANLPAFETADLRHLEVAIIAGAPVPLPVMERYMARDVAILQAYGMTETVMCVLMLEPSEARRKLGSAGKPLMRTEIRIVDSFGDDVAVGQPGELWTRGPNVVPGYWNNDEANERSFSDGWLKTGDVARQDDEGFVYIIDRAKDIYISGGENVSPAEVESVLFQLPAVSEAAVVGIPSERWGETGAAYIVVRPGYDLTVEEVRAHCSERLARFKHPAEVHFVDQLPRNAAGKLLKHKVREQAAADGRND